MSKNNKLNLTTQNYLQRVIFKTGNRESGNGNGESLKAGIFKMGNL